MNPFRFAALALVLFGTFLLTGCPPPCYPDIASGPPPEGPPLAHLGAYTVTVSAPDVDNLRTVAAYRGTTPVTQYKDPVRDVSTTVAQGFPLPECTSQTVEMFTGGANCCFGYYIFTACPDGQHAAYVEPMDGSLGAPVNTLKAYPVSDPSFMYYGKDNLSFIRPDSPRLTRYLVFDNGSWRADTVGEFVAVYRGLASKALADGKMDKTAKAITVTYYSYMSGTPESSLKKTLRSALPAKHRSLSASIFEDIKKAADGFDPVKNIAEQ